MEAELFSHCNLPTSKDSNHVFEECYFLISHTIMCVWLSIEDACNIELRPAYKIL